NDSLKIHLQPWAVVKGILIKTNGVPVANETLALTRFDEWHHGGALVNLQERVSTAQGRFIFSNAPPGRLEVQRLVPRGKNSYSYQQQTWFFAESGITNDLGKIIYDTPPPPPMIDKIKQKLGL